MQLGFRALFCAVGVTAGLLSVPALAAWEQYDDTDASTAFFDSETVARDGNLVKLTVRMVHKKTMNTPDGMSYVESEYLLALDCSSMKYAVTDLKHLAKIRAALVPIAEQTYPREKWDFAPPGAGKSTEFFQSVCDRMRPAGPAVTAAAAAAAPLALAAAPVAIESVPIEREPGQAADGLYYKKLVWGMTEEELLKSNQFFRCRASASAPGDRQCEISTTACPPMQPACSDELDYANAFLNSVTVQFFGNRLVAVDVSVADHNVVRVKQWLTKTYGEPAGAGPSASDANNVEVTTWERKNAFLRLSTVGTREASIRVSSKAGEHELAARAGRAAAATAALRVAQGVATVHFVRRKADSTVAYDVMSSGDAAKLGTLPGSGGTFVASVPAGPVELWATASSTQASTSKLALEAAANSTYYVALDQGLFSTSVKQIEKDAADQIIAELTAAPAVAAAEPAPSVAAAEPASNLASSTTSEPTPTASGDQATDSAGSTIAKAFSFLPAIVGAATAVAGLRFGDMQVAASGAQLAAGATLDPNNMDQHINQFMSSSQSNIDRLKAQQQSLGAGSGVATASASGADVGSRCAAIASGLYPENTQNRLQMRAGCIYHCAWAKTSQPQYRQLYEQSQRNANSLCSAGMGNCNTINTGACRY